MKPYNDMLPIGYIRCLKCHRPALWLFQNVRYSPVDADNVKMSANYTMDNIKAIYDSDIMGCYVCDSCLHEISDDNLQQEHMVFLEDLECKYDH